MNSMASEPQKRRYIIHPAKFSMWLFIVSIIRYPHSVIYFGLYLYKVVLRNPSHNQMSLYIWYYLAYALRWSVANDLRGKRRVFL